MNRALKRRLLLLGVVVAALTLSPQAAATVSAPVYDPQGNLIETPFAPPADQPRLTEAAALQTTLAVPKVRDWVARYPEDELTREATYDSKSGLWRVKVWAQGDAGQIVLARVDDTTGQVTEAWTGPQVAWKMARGYKGSFGRKINDLPIWLGFCAAFVLGLADWRRVRSVRNLDVLVLLSFSISLWYFNEGRIFTSAPLAYPPLLYLLGRMVWIGRGSGGSRVRSVWPVWVLLAATVFLAGFRIGLNVRSSNVIDVGYASVIGAQRIAAQGESPYGHMPTDDGVKCGDADVDGYVRERIQTNGRCESANERGDTYGPATYLGYVPGYALFGWSGRWDELPAAHFTSILFDMLVLVGLGLAGRRFGGARLGATLAFAWAAYPFTQYVSSSNSNDAVMPALLVWGFLLVTSAPARGAFVALAGWAKFAAFLLVPLWASYPTGLRRPRGLLGFTGGLALGTALSLWILFLEPDPLHAARVLWDRTFGWQLSRASPFSIWDWDQYRYPDLSALQTALKVVLLLGAIALAFVPRVKTPLQLAALTGAILIGFELVLTHWFYLYIPWFFPFVAFAVLAPAAAAPASRPEARPHDRPVRELVAAGK